MIKCVVVGYNPVFESVKTMVMDRYSLPVYKDSLVVLAYNNISCDIDKIRTENPGKKIIIYQLEQLYENKSQWYNEESSNTTILKRTKHIEKCLKGCDEIWDYSLNNIRFLKSLGYKNVKYMPMVYSQDLNKRYDILFYGSINDRRAEFLSCLDKYNLLVIAPANDLKKYKNRRFTKNSIPNTYGESLFNHVFKSKIVLNLHYYDSCIQEQVRIFELLINDSTVVSEKSRINHFGDLVKEFNSKEEMLKIIDSILDNSISQKFKNFSQKKDFKVGAAYNTFYGLEMIEESINSIKNVVDYIVIVHQKKGFNGNPEPKENKEILERLRAIAEIVYYKPGGDKRAGVLEKRNIGLEYCKKNDCDFIMPLDTDEIYNEIELLHEIKFMHKNNIDTLYSSIKAYYYSRDYYFNDTYYVPSVYKINQRKFEKQKSSVLCDPLRKMKEGNYRVSKMPMHHYTYLLENFIEKVDNSIMSMNPDLKDNKQKIKEHLLKFKPGNKALVHMNRGNGDLYLTLTDLKHKTNKEIPKRKVSVIIK
jgi:hypothetical protein